MTWPPASPSQTPTSLINGIFANQAELEAYQLELDANGYPELPLCLDRRPLLLAAGCMRLILFEALLHPKSAAWR